MLSSKSSKWCAYTDKDLVDGYQNKQEQEALAELFTRYTAILFGICMKYLKNEDDAKDMVQHLYERVAKYLLINKVENFGGWVYTVAKNSCINALQKNGLGDTLFLDEDTEIIDTDSCSLYELLEKEKRYDQVSDCIAALSDIQQKVIGLFYYKKYCYNEIAEKMQAEWKTVRSLIQSARRNLKICVQKTEKLYV